MNTWKYWKNDMGICAVGPDGRNPVARVFDDGEQGGRVAALISAAPELLAACTDAERVINGPIAELLTGDSMSDTGAYEALRLLQEAIRKARGEG